LRAVLLYSLLLLRPPMLAVPAPCNPLQRCTRSPPSLPLCPSLPPPSALHLRMCAVHVIADCEHDKGIAPLDRGSGEQRVWLRGGSGPARQRGRHRSDGQV
jgi:hypothetical protein